MQKQDRLSRKRFLTAMGQGVGALALGGVVKPYAAAEPVPALSTPPGSLQLPYRLRQVNQIDAPFERIRDLAFDAQSRLLVAGGTGVRILTSEGHPESEILTPSAVQSVAVDKEGSVYAGLRKEVLCLDPSGIKRGTWTATGGGQSGFGFITCLSLYEEKVYIADAGNRCIYRFASDGDYIDEIEGFHIPSAYFDCAVDSKGTLHVAHTSEHRVESYDPNGELVAQWGQYGGSPADFCGCCNPTNLCLISNGWIVTGEKGIPRLKIHDASGKLQAMLSPEELGLKEERSYLAQIRQSAADSLPCHDGWPGMPAAMDSAGRLAVSIPGLKQIRLYEIQPA